MSLIDKIGTKEMLEQTAEESAELSKACLKLARKMRGVNPVPKTFDELHDKFCEAIADMYICLDELSQSGYYNEEKINEYITQKREQVNDRFEYKKMEDAFHNMYDNEIIE